MISDRLAVPHLIPSTQTRADVDDLRALTTSLARGDDAAWLRFDREFGPAIFRQLLALTRGDCDLAKEARQQTYLRIARHVRPCDSLPMFRSWLRTVARTALVDCWRRRRSFTDLIFRRSLLPPQFAEPTTDEQLFAALEAALATITPDERAILTEKYLVGAEVAAIAHRRDISTKAAESRLTRAREALRRAFRTELSRHA